MQHRTKKHNEIMRQQAKKERKPLFNTYQNIVRCVEQQTFILQQIRQLPKNRLSVVADVGILGLNLFSFWVKKP